MKFKETIKNDNIKCEGKENNEWDIINYLLLNIII